MTVEEAIKKLKDMKAKSEVLLYTCDGKFKSCLDIYKASSGDIVFTWDDNMDSCC